MFFFRKPDPSAVRALLEEQGRLELTYSEIGATNAQPPAGYRVDRTRVAIGAGPADFEAARQALERWQQFQLAWLEPCRPQAPIAAGQVVGLLARALGMWWLYACKIVYVIREEEPQRRFGFAYGTLPRHAGSGEERFLVEFDPRDGVVWYDILAFSRPHAWWAKAGYPYLRRKQKQFGRASAAAMRRAVVAAERCSVE